MSETRALSINGHLIGMPIKESEGNISIKKLWENPDPTAEFVQQDIELSSDDYDFLLMLYESTANSGNYLSVISEKGKNLILNGIGNINYHRTARCQSDTVLTVSSSQDNNYNVPTVIYGIKSSISL